MPEGPEIRLAADKIAAAIVGKPADELFFAFAHLKEFETALAGQPVLAVETYGKAILTRFENQLNIYSHNQLYGKWVIRNAYDYPESTRQLRLAIHNQEKSALLYSASTIEVLHDNDLSAHPFLSKIGPDLLDPTLTVEQVAARFTHKRFRRKRLTTLLLDQHFLAGLGNYLRTEVLYVARVHPSLRPMDCTPEQIDALAHATVKLTRQSYDTRGITMDLALFESLKAKGWSRRNARWWVFERDGEPCHICSHEIVKDVIGGRRLYYCDLCQISDSTGTDHHH